MSNQRTTQNITEDATINTDLIFHEEPEDIFRDRDSYIHVEEYDVCDASHSHAYAEVFFNGVYNPFIYQANSLTGEVTSLVVSYKKSDKDKFGKNRFSPYEFVRNTDLKPLLIHMTGEVIILKTDKEGYLLKKDGSRVKLKI